MFCSSLLVQELSRILLRQKGACQKHVGNTLLVYSYFGLFYTAVSINYHPQCNVVISLSATWISMCLFCIVLGKFVHPAESQKKGFCLYCQYYICVCYFELCHVFWFIYDCQYFFLYMNAKIISFYTWTHTYPCWTYFVEFE